MSQLVSIIVPVYNIEQYLERCLKSVLSQTYKNFEVLLIDDGSTDESLEICYKYEKIDLRFKVFHKENGGLSSARNYGIDRARGKWLYFLDSDDWISNNVINDLVTVAEKDNCQITMGSFILCHSEDEFDSIKIDDEVVYYNNKEALHEMTTGLKFVFYSCNRLYDRELFGDFRFPVGKLYEDMFTIYKVVDLADKIAYIPQARYAYFQRGDSIANRRYNSRQLDWYKAVAEYRDYCKEKHSDLHEVINNFMVFVCVSLINKMILSGNDKKDYIQEYNLMILEIKKCYKEYMISRNPGLAVNLKYKISTTVLMISNILYEKLLKIIMK